MCKMEDKKEGMGENGFGSTTGYAVPNIKLIQAPARSKRPKGLTVHGCRAVFLRLSVVLVCNGKQFSCKRVSFELGTPETLLRKFITFHRKFC